MIRKLLIANRGEIAIRIARSAAELGIATVAVFSEDDAAALHTRKTDDARALLGSGPAAYLDGAQIIAAAQETGCDAIHPGYGFLSENADFAQACGKAGIVFIGPAPETLAAFGDKARAREIARACDVPVLPGTGAVLLEQARAFFREHGAVMLKAVAGGGGRGMRLVQSEAELDSAFARCASEAKSAFGNDAVYAEGYMPQARHIEVQIVGDGKAVSHLWDRDCSIQRQRQKLIEIAPALTISDEIRNAVLDAAVRIASSVRYKSLGTIEFLVDAEHDHFVFIEANPRLQVEHTVTEEVLGLDLVRIQLEIAGGASLGDVHLRQGHVPFPRGVALQARINMETMQPDGSVRPAGGTIDIYEPPSGRGVRVDGFGYSGYRTSARFDSLLAKLIVHTPSARLADAVSKAYRALSEFRVVGVPTNIPFLQNVLRHHAFESGTFHTRTLEDNLEVLLPETEAHKALFVTAERPPARAGVHVDSGDPLAVLHHGKTESQHHVAHSSVLKAPDGMTPLLAPLQGTIVNFIAAIGDSLRAGEPVLVMEAMKMEHVIEANAGGVLREYAVAPGDTVFEDTPLAFIEAAHVAGGAAHEAEAIDLDRIRPDLEELYKRRETTLDRARPEAVERRRKTNQRTVRENVEDLCDPGSFVEYASFVVAGRLRRNTMEELIARTPGDGLVMGLGRVNGNKFPDEQARVVVMAYDYTVLAGTQGLRNHQKKDRLLQIAEQWRIPIVFFTEGGGGRPGDTDAMSAGGLNVTTFHQFAKLSGLVPLVGINSGYCFAGNAALLGCCDVIIATKNSSIGMGGPAMIEGGGLGVFHPKEVGPVSVQAPNGVIDIVVEDEAEGVAVAKKYLSYFQGALSDWSCEDQRLLRNLIPENRLRVYDIRKVIDALADTDSVLEIRRDFGVGMVVALARIEGRPIGVIANNPKHLGGAIDRDGSDKAARFMQLCDAYDIPLLMLCDTPGNMVGPEAEKEAMVRHNSRLFVTAATLSVPFFTVVLRKGYGLGAQAMAAGDFSASAFTISWPTGEFGPMGLEGAVRLGYRKELEAEADPDAREALYQALVAGMYESGKAVNVARLTEIDAVIDPAETRGWIVRGLKSAGAAPPRTGKKRPFVDVW